MFCPTGDGATWGIVFRISASLASLASTYLELTRWLILFNAGRLYGVLAKMIMPLDHLFGHVYAMCIGMPCVVAHM